MKSKRKIKSMIKANVNNVIEEQVEQQDQLLLVQAKQHTEDDYLFLLNNINQGYCIIEVIWGTNDEAIDYRFLEVNKAFEKQTGLVDAVGKRMRQLEPDHEEHWYKTYGRVAKSGMAVQFEAEAKLIAGWYEVTAFPAANGNNRVAILFNDISERKQSEKLLKGFNQRLAKEVQERTTALEESQKLLKATLDSSKNSTQVLQVSRNEYGEIEDFHWIFINKLAEEVLGKVIGRCLLADKQDIKSFEKYRHVVETGEPLAFEEIFLVKLAPKWYDINLVKLNDGVVVKGLDVTERKEAELKLKRSNRLLQSVFDTSLIGMSVLEAVRNENGDLDDFKIKLINKELERLTNRKDLVGKYYLQEYPGIKTSGVLDAMLKVMRTGEPVQIEYAYAHDGFNKWFSSMFVKMDDGLVATNLDITERKLAEEKIKEDDVLLRGIAEAAPDMVYVIDIRSMQMVYGNNKMASLFHKSLEEIKSMGSSLFDQVIYPEDRAKFYANINALKETKEDGEVKELIYRLINQEGNIHWIQTRRTVLKRDELGVPSHIIGISLDVTEQVKLHEKNLELMLERRELEKRQQREIFMATLKAQEEERKRIAENLHNGLGQLLYGVKLSLDNIQSKKEAQNIAPEQSQLKQAERLLKEAIRESRRISHELMPTILEDFGLQTAIEDICEQFNKTINFKCKFIGLDEELDKYTEIAIYRMVQELIINIIKHAKASEASVVIKVNEHLVQILIEDNGIGFKEQADRRGIGLSTIQNKMRLLNGSLNITSISGKGSVIHIQFPNKRNNSYK